MEKFLSGALLEISNLLLIPVIVCLLLLLFWTVIICGGFLAEFFKRKKHQAFRSVVQSQITKSEKDTDQWLKELQHHRPPSGIIPIFLYRIGQCEKDPLNWAKMIDDVEAYSANILMKCSLGIKIGPMLGLMGALIPLGPALVALSAGNINELARQMTVAFTTTVVGLLIGGLSYIITQVRKKWYHQDINDIKYVYEIIFRTWE